MCYMQSPQPGMYTIYTVHRLVCVFPYIVHSIVCVLSVQPTSYSIVCVLSVHPTSCIISCMYSVQLALYVCNLYSPHPSVYAICISHSLVCVFSVGFTVNYVCYLCRPQHMICVISTSHSPIYV